MNNTTKSQVHVLLQVITFEDDTETNVISVHSTQQGAIDEARNQIDMAARELFEEDDDMEDYVDNAHDTTTVVPAKYHVVVKTPELDQIEFQIHRALMVD